MGAYLRRRALGQRVRMAAELRLGAAELRELNRIGVNLNQMARALNSRAVSSETQAAVAIGAALAGVILTSIPESYRFNSSRQIICTIPRTKGSGRLELQRRKATISEDRPRTCSIRTGAPEICGSIHRVPTTIRASPLSTRSTRMTFAFCSDTSVSCTRAVRVRRLNCRFSVSPPRRTW